MFSEAPAQPAPLSPPWIPAGCSCRAGLAQGLLLQMSAEPNPALFTSEMGFWAKLSVCFQSHSCSGSGSWDGSAGAWPEALEDSGHAEGLFQSENLPCQSLNCVVFKYSEVRFSVAQISQAAHAN